MLHSKRESAKQIIHPSCNSGLCTPRGTVVRRFPSHQTSILRTTFLPCVQPSYGCWPMRRPEPSQPDSGLFHQCPDPPGASLSQWLLTRPVSWTLLCREQHNSYYWFVPSRGLPLRHPIRRLRFRPHTRTQRHNTHTALFSVELSHELRKNIVISQPIVLPPVSARRILPTASSLSPLICVTWYDIFFVRKQKCRKGGLPFSYFFTS